jgi:hypothetical protein
VSSPLENFIPRYDAREHFEVRVHAPASLVFTTAAGFDLQAIPLIRGIFQLRARLLHADPTGPALRRGPLLASMPALGWGTLVNTPGQLFVAGAAGQPWLANVVFHPLTADNFSSYTSPNQVKIAWTLEAIPLDESQSRLRTETRAVATDPEARTRFRRYWRWARFGILPIRWLLLPAIRREAERRFRPPPGGPTERPAAV